MVVLSKLPSISGMLKFKGTMLYLPALFDLLNSLEEIKDFVAEVYTNEIGMDEVLLHIVPVSYTDDTTGRSAPIYRPG